jgi:Na+/melibiose symporter-like transporter
VVAAALGALDSLFNPALQASLPALAPDPPRLQRLNAALNVNHRIALVVGPTLTGALLTYVPIERFFGVDAVSFALSALMILALGRAYAWRPRATERAPGLRGVASEIVDALRLVRAHQSLSWAIAALALCNVTWGALVVGVPLFARDVLHGGPETYGYLMGAYGVGNVLSNIGLASLTVRRRALVLFSGGVVFAVGCAALVCAPSLGAAMLLAALAALGGPMTDLMLLLIVQTDFPADRIGKVWSFRGLVAQVGIGVGLAVAAPTFAGLGVARATALMAAPAALFSLVGAVRFRAE